MSYNLQGEMYQNRDPDFEPKCVALLWVEQARIWAL